MKGVFNIVTFLKHNFFVAYRKGRSCQKRYKFIALAFYV